MLGQKADVVLLTKHRVNSGLTQPVSIRSDDSQVQITGRERSHHLITDNVLQYGTTYK